MLKPFGLSVVVDDATFARATIVESPPYMVTLSTLAVQISISDRNHFNSGNQRKGDSVFRSLRRKWMCNTDLQKPGAGQDRHGTKSVGQVMKPSQRLPRGARSIMVLVANFLP